MDRHGSAGWIFHLAFFHERKAKLAADRIRSRILYRWKCMHELVFRLLQSMFNHSRGGLCCNAMSLVGWQYQPADFVNCLVPPRFSPITNVAHTLFIRTPGNPEHMIRPVFRKVQVTLVTPEDLFLAFGSTEMLHHLRVAQEFLKQLQVSF